MPVQRVLTSGINLAASRPTLEAIVDFDLAGVLGKLFEARVVVHASKARVGDHAMLWLTGRALTLAFIALGHAARLGILHAQMLVQMRQV